MARSAAFVFCELIEESATLRRGGGGRELATLGDGVLAAFESATDGIRFASAVLRGCDRESRRSSERLDVRLGIDVGETEALDDAGRIQGALAVARAQALAREAPSGSALASGVAAAVVQGDCAECARQNARTASLSSSGRSRLLT